MESRVLKRRATLKNWFQPIFLSEKRMDEVIQFMANYSDWKSIKKLRIEPATEPRTIMEFLASLETGIDRKIEANLRKIVELDKVDAAIAKLELAKGKENVGIAIAEVNSRKINSVIKEICTKPELQKNEQKELVGFCKVYAMRKALNETELSVDYTSIKIPGLKRMMKKKA